MLTKNQIKLITQLKNKKYRETYGLFVVEGVKSVQEFLKEAKFELEELYVTNTDLFEDNKIDVTLITTNELKKISNFKNPNTCLAVFKKKNNIKEPLTNGLRVVLDRISDPGNLGTIIRLCDWFGVETLYCSESTVDCFNPKVVQATMGSLNRVQLVYTDIVALLEQTDFPVYGAFMDGKVIYNTEIDQNAFLVIGNEANGISKTIETLITSKITIPKFGRKQQTESLNAAIATGILLSEFSRR